MRRLQQRLNRLESHAHATMSDAQRTADTATDAVDELRGVLLDFVADLQDGIELEIEVAGRLLPVTIKIKP